jgi:preprotein translocase subunit SecG
MKIVKPSKIMIFLVALLFLLPVGLSNAAADDTNTNKSDEVNLSTRGYERTAIPDKDEKTIEFHEILTDNLGMGPSSYMSEFMKGPELYCLGKDPNKSLGSFWEDKITSKSRGTRDADDSIENAIELVNNQASLNTSVSFDINDQVDWYKVSLTNNQATNFIDECEIKIKNWENTTGNNISVVLFDNWPWIDRYALVSNIIVSYTPQSGPTVYAGGIAAGELYTIKVRAPRTGTYYMVLLGAALGTDLHYEIQSVKISSKAKAAPDSNNEPVVASKETGSNFINTVRQSMDHWNWHNISSNFHNTGPDWEYNVSYSVRITSEYAGAIPEFQAVSEPDLQWMSWTMWIIMFNDDEGNWWYQHDWFGTGVCDTVRVRVGQNMVRWNPRSNWFIANGTYAFMGFSVMSIIFQQTQQGVDWIYWRDIAQSDYSVTLSNIEEIDLNFKPQLNFGGVAIEGGTLSGGAAVKGSETDNFTFEVTWVDENNEPPTDITVTIDDDPAMEFDLEKKNEGDVNYDEGVVYTTMVAGDVLGDDPYPHKYTYWGTDGRKETLEKSFTNLYVYKNVPVQVHPDAKTKYVMNEDDPAVFLNLYDYFLDPDGKEDFKHDPQENTKNDAYTLNFKIRNEDDTEWGTLYKNDFVLVTLYDTGDNLNQIKIQPLENKHGIDTIRLRAIDQSLYESDLFEWYVDFNLTILVEPVNDAPVMISVPDFTKASAGALKQGTPWEYTFNASDVDTSVLMFSTDIVDVLTIDGERVLETRPEDFDFAFDPWTGKISFTPTNEFVTALTRAGEHVINVTVTDNDLDNPKYDYDEFKIEIQNKNDPPVIKSVGTKDVIEGTALVFNAKQNQKLELQIYAEDPDIDIGIDDRLKYKMDHVPRSNLLLDEESGELTFIPNQDDVDNRTTTIELTVEDSSYARDTVEIKIKVDNVNDPPSIKEVQIIIDDADVSTPQPENLTIKFAIVDPYDPDGDTMSFSWDFDTNENLDNIGGSDDDNQLVGMENIQHRYPKAGIYQGLVTIKDSNGATVKYNFTVQVVEPKFEIDTSPPIEKDTDEGALGLGTYGGIDAAYLIILLVIIIIVTMIVVMLIIRKKKEEIEKMRHQERFRDESEGEAPVLGPDGLPLQPEGQFDELGAGAFHEEPAAARTAGELYKDDTAAMKPSAFDMPPAFLPPSAPPAAGPQPYSTPPAATPSLPPAAAADSDMKCTSCGTPVNAEWFICPQCHRFLK